MKPIVIAFVVLVMAAYSNVAYNIDKEKTVGKPYVKNTANEKQESENEEESQESLSSFIEEKLIHQNQALEHLIKQVDRSSDIINKLIDNLSKGLEQPKLPIKAEAAEVPNNRLKNRKNTQTTDNPIVKLGKNIPKYGKLAKDLIMKDVYTGTDPTPLVEENISFSSLKPGSRRSFGGDPEVTSDKSRRSDDIQANPWCPMALLCQKTSSDAVCGFDDVFGYGRFEDFCHLLRVNCYWKYNFSVVNTCRPKL